MAPLIAHVLLALAVLALGAAGLRAGAALGAAGLQRVLAALPIAATAAALGALALGPLDLGTDPLALTVAAGAIWLAAGRLLPAPRRPLSAELGEEWAGLPTASRVAFGAFAGIVIALAIWFLRNPALVGDGLVYHVPIVATWVSGGDPPSLNAVAQDAPLEAYPLTTELLATWAAGIARSFVPITLWNPAMLALLVLACWSGLRSLGASRSVAALAVAALATSPLLVGQLNTFTTDIPALAWLVCCAALCAASVRAPGLLVAAVLAAGLAIGTKTTAAPLAFVCLGVAAVAARGQVRPLSRALVAAAIAATVVGGLWYLRNLVRHGSPLWPFVTTPWGDPAPFLFTLSDDRLLWEPSSAQGRLDEYARAFYGGLVLLAGGLAAVLLAWSGRVLAACGATAFALLVWANAPFTAFPPDAVFDILQAGSVRYLLPGIAAGALALALAASSRGAGRHIAVGLLAIALIANLVGDARLGLVGDFGPAVGLEVDPMLPSFALPVAGAAVGIAIVLALGALRQPTRTTPQRLTRPGLARAAWVVGALIAGALLALPASGYVKRSAALGSIPAAEWLVTQPGYAENEQPVMVGGRVIGTLAGDRLQHPLSLAPPQPDCARVREAAREGWVVLHVSTAPASASPEAQGFLEYAQDVRESELATARCMSDLEPAYSDEQYSVYGPGEPG